MNPIESFFREVADNIKALASETGFRALSRQWLDEATRTKYSYNFTWMGRPVIQLPQDIVAMQELVWRLKPDLIVETGVAHGGSLVFYASMLELLGGDGLVVGVDIDIRSHNREAIEAHPMSKRIRLIQGSSIEAGTLEQVRAFLPGRASVMVVLDSNHTHDHVLRELELYAPMVTKGNYLVVFDTVIEELPKKHFPHRPWGPGDNPWTAVQAFLKHNDRFEIDHSIPDKLQITVAPDG